MDITSELSRSLKQHLPWNKCRIECFAKMIVALFVVKTVNLTEWAQAFITEANAESAYMRIKRFFRHYCLDMTILSKFIFHVVGLGHGRWYLTVDRTNWEFGRVSINILMLAIVYKGIAIPMMWTLLPSRGNSNTKERKELMNRFISCFGRKVIAGVLADREFVGKEWFDYLVKEKIPFYIRVKWNFLITNQEGREVNGWQLFGGLKKGEIRILRGKRKVFGLEFNIAGLRCYDGGLLIVATTESAENAIEIYGLRWEIETLFGCLKTRGFNLEDTHLTKHDRLAKLIAVLAVAFCWAHKMGEWQHEIKPIKIKKHGRKAVSLFRYGLNILRRIFVNRISYKKLPINIVNMLFDPPQSPNLVQIGVTP